MLFPDSAIKYQSAVHAELIREVEAGQPYRHACSMVAIEFGKRLQKSSFHLPELVMVKASDKERLLPSLYKGNDGFGSHMITVHEGLAYDMLAPGPVSVSEYPGNIFLNPEVTLRYCGAAYTLALLQRDEPTMYENGLFMET